MEYTWNHYLFFFFAYALLGWVMEELFAIIKRGKLVNRGFLNGPICPKYGLCMLLLISDMKDLTEHPVYQFLLAIVVVSVFEYITGVLLKLVTGKRFWDYSKYRWNLNGYICARITLIWSSISVMVYFFIHPFLYMGYELVPLSIMKVVLLVLSILVITDVVVTVASSLQWKIQHKLYENIAQKFTEAKHVLGVGLFTLIQNRMYRAFPEFVEQEKTETDGFGRPESSTFAEGLCFDKLIWIFFISALAGDLIETVFVWATSGQLMSRSSLLYGQFSIVWGLGGALATGLLYSFRNKNDRYILIAGTIMGGVYEYSCSVFTEVVFGTTFWDYSHIPFNINGRVNLLYCFFWGIAAILWLKVLYPAVSKLIGKIPPVAGKIMTAVIIVFMILDICISGLALGRYANRQTSVEAGTEPSTNAITVFLDHTYQDALIEKRYPNMILK